jgi:hypothetical protein
LKRDAALGALPAALLLAAAARLVFPGGGAPSANAAPATPGATNNGDSEAQDAVAEDADALDGGAEADEYVNVEVPPVITLWISTDETTISSPILGVDNNVGVTATPTLMRVTTNNASGFDVLLQGAAPVSGYAGIDANSFRYEHTNELGHAESISTYSGSAYTRYLQAGSTFTKDSTPPTAGNAGQWGYYAMATSYSGVTPIAPTPPTFTSGNGYFYGVPSSKPSTGSISQGYGNLTIDVSSTHDRPTEGWYAAVYFGAQINAETLQGKYVGKVKYTAVAKA